MLQGVRFTPLATSNNGLGENARNGKCKEQKECSIIGLKILQCNAEVIK